MKNKRLITGLCSMLLIFTLVLVSCGNNTPVTNTTSTSTSTSQTTNPTDSTTPVDTTTTEEILFPDIKRISIEELKAKIDQNADMIIIDTRDLGSYAAGHIPKAVDFTYEPVGDPQEFNMKLWILPSDKLLVVYCDCPDESTSGIVAERIKEQVFIDEKLVVLLKGGWMAWRTAGYPIATGETLEGGSINPNPETENP